MFVIAGIASNHRPEWRALAPIYWLPHKGVPQMREGERGLVLLRPPIDADAAALLDERANRVVDQPQLVVWELSAGNGAR